MGRISTEGFQELRKKVEKMQEKKEEFLDSCIREIAGKLLREVIQRTPVGDYTGGIYQCKARKGPRMVHQSWKAEGLTGGTLKKGWTAQGQGPNHMTVHHFGDTYVIEIINPVPYASYVEYGHRTANHRGWVRGHFMMRLAEQDIQKEIPALLSRKTERFLRECLR